MLEFHFVSNFWQRVDLSRELETVRYESPKRGMMKSRQLRQIISSSSGQFTAELIACNELKITLNGYKEVLQSDKLWIVEDWPELNWQGDLFFHRGHGTIYLVKSQRDFNNSIYPSRLQGFQKMVSWVSDQPVGFTISEKVEEIWGYLLVNPWLVSSTDNRWLQRIKVFSALNEFDPTRWPLSLLVEKWNEVRKIIF